MLSLSPQPSPNLLKLSPPDPGGDHCVSPPHGSRLENVRDLRVNGLVVASPVEISTVSRSHVIRVVIWIPFGELHREKARKPFIKDDVLVCSDGELASTVEQPLVFLSTVGKSASKLPCPELVHTEPQDSHGEKESIFVSTRVSNGWIKEVKLKKC